MSSTRGITLDCTSGNGDRLVVTTMDGSPTALLAFSSMGVDQDDATVVNVSADDVQALADFLWREQEARITATEKEAGVQKEADDVVDAAILCGYRDGELECCLNDGHASIIVRAVDVNYLGHVTSSGAVFNQEVF